MKNATAYLITFGVNASSNPDTSEGVASKMAVFDNYSDAARKYHKYVRAVKFLSDCCHYASADFTAYNDNGESIIVDSIAYLNGKRC